MLQGAETNETRMLHNIARFRPYIGALDRTHVKLQSSNGGMQRFIEIKYSFSLSIKTVASLD